MFKKILIKMYIIITIPLVFGWNLLAGKPSQTLKEAKKEYRKLLRKSKSFPS